MPIYISEKYQQAVDEAFVSETLLLAMPALIKSAVKLDGRGETFIRDSEPPVITKRYRRGGMIGKILRHSYLRIYGCQPRMLEELELLEQLMALELPAPKPIAAVIEKHSLFYSGYLLMEFIPDTNTLASFLLKKELTPLTWQKIGKTIRRFHDASVFHADLNATNILLDKDENIYLIDFDKSEIRTEQKTAWKTKNLARLLRSLRKIKRNHQNLLFHQDDWDHLINAYQNSI